MTIPSQQADCTWICCTNTAYQQNRCRSWAHLHCCGRGVVGQYKPSIAFALIVGNCVVLVTHRQSGRGNDRFTNAAAACKWYAKTHTSSFEQARIFTHESDHSQWGNLWLGCWQFFKITVQAECKQSASQPWAKAVIYSQKKGLCKTGTAICSSKHGTCAHWWRCEMALHQEAGALYSFLCLDTPIFILQLYAQL